MPTPFDDVGDLADRYGNWDARLRLEIPFIASSLRKRGARRVCDGGCAEGRHAIALAQLGFEMTGVDPGREALEKARRLAQQAAVSASFHEGVFQSLPQIPGAPFDAVYAWGNSLSLVGEWADLEASIQGIAGALVEGGLLLFQVLNYGLFDDPANCWKPLRATAVAQGADPELLVKHFAPWGADHFAVEFLRLWRDPQKGWLSEVKRNRLLALGQENLERRLAPRFEILERHGNADARPFGPNTPDLIIAAKKKQ